MPCSALALVWLAFAPPTGAGGENNPENQACAGKAEGDACTRTVVTKTADSPLQKKMVPGVCQTSECCDLDYSKGSPPATKCGPCLACKEGPATTAPADGGGDDAPAASASASAGESPAADGETPPPNDPGKRGCRVGSAGGPVDSGWLWLLPLAATLRRRRQQFRQRFWRQPQ